jgi:D-alanyl-D-alanine carboxypeptidase
MRLSFGGPVVASLLLALASPAMAMAGPPDPATLTKSLQAIANDYLAKNAGSEGITAVSVSVSLAGAKAPIDVVAGRVSRLPGAAPVTPATLFPIGSITKSMTATVILQLVHDGALSLDAPIGPWFPEYPAWGSVTLRRLLDMTSGVPSYDSTDAFLRSLAQYGIHRHFSPAELLSFTDPALPGAPKPTTGYDYANVNYIIAGMVVERATGRDLDAQIRERLLTGGHGLDDTFYASGPYPDSVLSREVSSYMAASPSPILDSFVGQDLKDQDPSWAGAAGAAVATPEDVTRWVRLLFQGNVMAAAERQELTKLVSMKTGQPIAETTPDDKSGFGLGVAQSMVGTLRFWFYEGEPMGARVYYGYFPQKNVVIVIAVNAAGAATDNLGKALFALYEAVTGEVVVLPSSPSK